MKFPMLNIDGAKNETIEISDKIVKNKVNHKLIKFVIDWQLNRAKPRTAKTKQRNQIRGSTKKIIAQNQITGISFEKNAQVRSLEQSCIARMSIDSNGTAA